MNKTKEYGGIDRFRIIAALLIVAIHTSPFIAYSETADFIFTRVIARVAVPFFFMTSGFFLFGDPLKIPYKLERFLTRTGKIYGVAILLYLPVNIYTGYFHQEDLFLAGMKDILFDGTLYHLWYLPASLLGAWIAMVLFKRFQPPAAFAITVLLYLIGLLGDSYYGFAVKLPPVNAFYEGLFLNFDYTRNGIFFAPVFLVMGGIIARWGKQLRIAWAVAGTILFIILMTLEGLLLHHYRMQRHDSMYIFLLPCMFFLFQLILQGNGKGKPLLRDIPMVIYLIHPMVIILVRGAAKFLGLHEVFIENSLIHFLITAFGSILLSVLSVLLYHMIRKRKEEFYIHQKTGRAWLQVNMENLKHNVLELKKLMPKDCEIMGIVKANAYGHGACQISRGLSKAGVKAFGVATIEEGIALRKQGIRGEILILGYTDVTRANQLHRYCLTQTIIDSDYAFLLNSYTKKTLNVHIKIDSGMHRVGIWAGDMDKVVRLFQLKKLNICGIFTHLCVSDSRKEEDIIYTKQQVGIFYELLSYLENKGVTLPKIHIQGSYGFLNYPELHCDYARLGIALYGTLSSPNDKTRLMPDLRPVMELKARVVLIRDIKRGEPVSYGRAFTAMHDSKIALLPIGYADGLPRTLSCERGKVLLHGCQAPIIGRVCMDQLLIDVTDIPEVKPGDTATLIGADGENEITAAEVAENAGSITNELLSRLGMRLERVYVS